MNEKSKKTKMTNITHVDHSKDENTVIVKPKKGRGGTHNFLTTRDDQKGATIKRIGFPLIESFKKSITPAVTDDELQERLIEYFTLTIDNEKIPTVESMALFLGYDRTTLWRWENGHEGSTPFRRNLIKKAKEVLAAFDAELVMENKVNPAGYIFRAKNHYGMKDIQDHVISAGDPLGEKEDPEAIRRRLEGGVANSYETDYEEIED